MNFWGEGPPPPYYSTRVYEGDHPVVSYEPALLPKPHEVSIRTEQRERREFRKVWERLNKVANDNQDPGIHTRFIETMRTLSDGLCGFWENVLVVYTNTIQDAEWMVDTAMRLAANRMTVEKEK